MAEKLTTLSKSDINSIIKANDDAFQRELLKIHPDENSPAFKKALEKARKNGLKIDGKLRKLRTGVPTFFKDESGRIGTSTGATDYARGKKSSVGFSTKEAVEKKRSSRSGRILELDAEGEKWAKGLDDIQSWRKDLNSGKISRPEFDSKMTKLFKLQRGQWGKYDPATFDKSPMANGWPEGASREGYKKHLKDNYAEVKKIKEGIEKKTGTWQDVGHPRQGATNVGLSTQYRQHPTMGNQSLKGVLPEHKGKVKAATDDIRSKIDLDRAGWGSEHKHGLRDYLNKHLPEPKGGWNTREGWSESQKMRANFDKDFAPDAEAAMDKIRMEKRHTAERTYIRKASQIKNAPVEPKGGILRIIKKGAKTALKGNLAQKIATAPVRAAGTPLGGGEQGEALGNLARTGDTKYLGDLAIASGKDLAIGGAFNVGTIGAKALAQRQFTKGLITKGLARTALGTVAGPVGWALLGYSAIDTANAFTKAYTGKGFVGHAKELFIKNQDDPAKGVQIASN